jgi:hypothetical protein
VKVKRTKKPSKPVKPADLKVADNLFLQCRDFGHSWQWQTDFIPHREAGSRKMSYVSRLIICLRCGTVRMDEYLLPTFDRIKSSYIYPSDYLMPGHKGHVPVSTIRAEIMRRFKTGVWKP